MCNGRNGLGNGSGPIWHFWNPWPKCTSYPKKFWIPSNNDRAMAIFVILPQIHSSAGNSIFRLGKAFFDRIWCPLSITTLTKIENICLKKFLNLVKTKKFYNPYIFKKCYLVKHQNMPGFVSFSLWFLKICVRRGFLSKFPEWGFFVFITMIFFFKNGKIWNPRRSHLKVFLRFRDPLSNKKLGILT